MSSVVYPLAKSKDTYSMITSSFTSKKFVRIRNFGPDPCSLDAILMAISKEYQDTYDIEKRDGILSKFKQEFKNYIVAPGKESDTSLFKKIMRAYQLSNMKDQFRIKSIGDMKTIYDLIIVKKPNDNDKYLNFKASYPLFSTETRNLFLHNSNLFSLLDETFLKDMIEQRYITKIYAEKINKLNELLDEEEDPVKKREIEEYQEVLQFNMNRRNNMSPENLFHIIDHSVCKNEDIILRLISCVLKFNVYICRSWNTELSVIKRIIWDKDYNYIVLFKIDTPVSLTGIREDVGYETGGIKSSSGITTIIDSGKGKVFINDLDQIFNNDIDSYYLDKYMTYLNKLEPSTDITRIKNSYKEDSESDEDEGDEDEGDEDKISSDEEEIQKLEEEIKDLKIQKLEEEIKDIEMKMETKPKFEMKMEPKPKFEMKMEPKTKFEMKMEPNNKELNETYIPSFIRGYSDLELIKLLEIFVNPSGNYKNLPRERLELIYKNYITQNKEDSVNDIMKRISSK